MNVHNQIGVPGNLPKGNSEPTLDDVLTPLLPRLMIAAGFVFVLVVVARQYGGEFDFGLLGLLLRIFGGLALASVGWFYTRKTSFPPDVETLAFKIDGSVSFERVTDFLAETKKSIGVGDAILSGNESVHRLFVRVPGGDRDRFTRLIDSSGIEVVRLDGTSEFPGGNPPKVRIPA